MGFNSVFKRLKRDKNEEQQLIGMG